MKKIYLFILGLAFTSLFNAQTEDFAALMNDPSKSIKEVSKAFEQYWSVRDKSQKGKGWKPFKRWEYVQQMRVGSSSFIPDPSIALKEYRRIKEEISQNKQLNAFNPQANSVWQYVSPVNGVPTNGGAGRLCFVRFDPNNNNIIYVGAPAGGLWKSSDAGLSWNTNTDDLAVIGMSDLAIDPNNTNIMYLATGDRDASDTYSIGVLKSTDGGNTWNTTGLSYNVPQQKTVGAIIINPSNSNIVIAATSSGIYRTLDAGANWQLEKTGSFKEIKFKPGDPNTVYACGTGFYKSTDGGDNWSQITSGISLSGSLSRIAMAVTPADPNYVYLLAGQGNTGSYGFEGIYLSTNSGSSFTEQTSSPNILGWSTDGSDFGGQAWYDLVIAASPTNKDHIVTGGVNVWESYDGGVTMQLLAHWYGGGGVPYVHADVHALEFLPGSGTTLFAGTDGGIFKTDDSGASFTDLSYSAIGNGLQIGQMYKLGVSQSNSALTITGWQDNGTSIHNSSTGTASYVLGGDGMECAIDPLNANTMYAELYYGDINKSTNGGSSFFNIASSGGFGVDEDGGWVTPYILDPTVANRMYVGKKNLYKSNNGGNTFTTLSVTSVNDNFVAIAVSPSNPNYIYACKSSELWISTNGTSLSNISASLPCSGITYICVDPVNSNRIWITCNGYSSGSKVFYSSNGGSSWSNISFNLPNVPANTIVYEAGTNDGLYVGTDIGVFYKDSTMNSWLMYSSGLPNVIVTELEIQQSTGKLRAATYGRGLWEVDLYQSPTSSPIASFNSNRTTVCQNGSVIFNDNSSNFPNSWNWTFVGGTPSTDTTQSPVITYSTPGIYPVKLKAANSIGTDSLELLSYITVLNAPLASAGNDVAICKGDTVYLSASGGTTYVWAPTTSLSNAQINNPVSTTPITRNYTVTVSDINGCSATDIVTIKVTTPPATPFISAIGNDSLMCSNNNVFYQWYLNGTSIMGENNKYIDTLQNGIYSVVVTDTAGCGFSASSNFITVGIASLAENLTFIQLAPNPNNGNFNLIGFKDNGIYEVSIYNNLGQQLLSRHVQATSGKIVVKEVLLPGHYFIKLTDDTGKSYGGIRFSVLE